MRFLNPGLLVALGLMCCSPSCTSTAVGGTGSSVDLGTLDRKEPPSAKELSKPKRDEGVTKVGLRATASGSMSKDDKRNVYILVNPLSNPDTRNVWWVQERVDRDGNSFRCSCQFGEPAQGGGEYFAIVAVATDKALRVGEKLDGIPKGMTYTKLKIVKRSE